MLKLKARKQRSVEQEAIAQAEITNNPAVFFAKLAGGQGDNATLLQQQFDIILNDAIATEKKEWVKKLHEENKLMLKVLDDVRESKLELASKIRELETAKEWIRALKLHKTNDAIDGYMSSECPLRPDGRLDLQLSEEREALCVQVFDRLQATVMRHKAQQTELAEFLTNALKNITEQFLSENEEEAERLLGRLENVISAGPHNVFAANALSVALEKTMVAASAEKISLLLKEEVKKRLQQAKEEAKEDNDAEASAVPQSSSVHHLPSVPDNVAEEMRNLTAQNETLRQTVTQLRQKIAQQKIGIGSSSAPANKKPETPTNKPSAGAAPRSEESTTVVYDAHDTRASDAAVREDTQVSIATLSSSQPLFSTHHTAVEVLDDALPAPLQTLLREKMKGYVHQIVEGHPIASRLTADAIKLAEDELLTHCMDMSYAAYTALLLNEKNENVKHLLNNKTFSEDLMKTKDVLELLHHVGNNVMKLTTVHTEIISLATLYLTYMFQRSAEFSTPSSSAPPVRTAPIADDAPRPAPAPRVADHSDTESVTLRSSRPAPFSRQQGAFEAPPSSPAYELPGSEWQPAASDIDDEHSVFTQSVGSRSAAQLYDSQHESLSSGPTTIRPRTAKTDNVPRYMQPKRSSSNMYVSSGSTTPR